MCPSSNSGVLVYCFSFVCYSQYGVIDILRMYCSLPVVTLTYRALHVKNTLLLLFRHDSWYSEVGSSNRGWILLAFTNVYAMIWSMGISPVFRQKLCATVEYIYSLRFIFCFPSWFKMDCSWAKTGREYTTSTLSTRNTLLPRQAECWKNCLGYLVQIILWCMTSHFQS
jgi:hypothetical protein